MFSPIFAIVSLIESPTVIEPTLACLIFSTSAPADIATSEIIFTRPWKRSLRATKSVSELTSTMMPFVLLTLTPIKPSAATRPAFLAAFDRPFLRSQSIAASMSPLFSTSAALQSIMPAPLVSRSSLTIAAVISAITLFLKFSAGAQQLRRYPSQCLRDGRLFRRQFFRLGTPGRHAAPQPNFFADIVGGLLVELGDVRVMEDTEIVEPLLNRARHAGEFLEVVGAAAQPAELLA